MASLVKEKESLENLSSKDSEAGLQKEPGSGDGPVCDKVTMPVSECPVSDEGTTRVDEGSVSDKVETTVGDGHASDNDETTVGDGHVSDKVETAVGEAPVSDKGVVIGGEGTVNDKVATTMGEASVSEDVASTVGEVPLRDNVVAVVSEAPVGVVVLATEAPVSNLNDAQSMQGKDLGNIDGPSDLSIVKVDDGSSDVKMAEVPVSSSSSIVRVPPEKRTLYKFGQRTSNFRGVTRHRWTGKYEAHLWDNSTITEGRKRKGKQVYLGGYESETKAAQAYDLAALKYWGSIANTKLNFPLSTYEKELEEMKDMSREEHVNSLRRKSICFTRGHSIYRGVTRQNEGRRWQARIGRVAGGKDIYLGTYDTEEEAAEAYDIAAVKLRGMNAITNFDISNYYKEGTKELDVIPIKSVEEEHSHLRIRYFKLE